MDFQRPLLIAAIAALALTLVVKWHHYEQALLPLAAPPAVVLESPIVGDVASGDAPVAAAASNGNHDVPQIMAHEPAVPARVNSGRIIEIDTDVFQLKIDTLGGDIVMAGLRDFPATLADSKVPFVMLTRTADHLYIAQSGLVGDNGTDKDAQRPQFTAEKMRYEMAGNNTLKVDLAFVTANGISITKRFGFTRASHVISIEYLINNASGQPWSAHLYGQIKRDSKEPVSQTSGLGLAPFLGAATTTSESHYYKMTFKEIAETPLKESKKGGWIAMVQHYFISAWVPPREERNLFFTKHQAANDTYLLGYTGPRVEVAAGGKGTLSTQFYVGPKAVYKLEALAPYLDLTVDYGWLWWIAKPLFWLMNAIHSLVGNWGFAIIGLTLAVKLLFLYPSTLSYRSMAAMKRLAPKMQEMKESYSDNPTKLREEMFKLYKKENANPMLGCLPMIIQTPVFIALYWTLMESVDLRQAPFMFWIHDLSAMDPYYVLPVLMGVSMWVQQKLNPPAADPMQQKIFQMMPLIFTGMFLFFPSGLVLYMLVNNLISMSHQYWVYKQLDKAKKA